MSIRRVWAIVAVVCIGSFALGLTAVAEGATTTKTVNLSVGQSATINCSNGTLQGSWATPLIATCAGTTTTSSTSTTVASTTTTTAPTPPAGVAIAPVGTLAAASAPVGANPVSLSVNPEKVGDLMLLGIEDSNTTPPTVSGVSGGGVSSWTLIASDSDVTYTQDGDEIWEGIVSAARGIDYHSYSQRVL